MISNYINWKNSSLIKESISTARDYYVSYLYKTNKLESDEKSKSIEREYLNQDEDWNEVISLINKFNAKGYAILFMRFKVEQQAPLDKIEILLKSITDPEIKPKLDQYLRMPMNRYGKVNSQNTVDNKQGWQLLEIDLEMLKNSFKSQWLISRLSTNASQGTVNQVKEWRDTPVKLKNEIIDLAYDLESKGKKKNIDTTKDFMKQMPAMGTIANIKKELLNHIHGVDHGILETIESLNKLREGARIIWKGVNKLVISFREPGALGMICKSCSWCIRPKRYGGDNAWKAYVKPGGYVQYVLLDFSKDAGLTSNEAWLGITTDKSGKITSANWKNNIMPEGVFGTDAISYISKFTDNKLVFTEMAEEHLVESKYNRDNYDQIISKEEYKNKVLTDLDEIEQGAFRLLYSFKVNEIKSTDLPRLRIEEQIRSYSDVDTVSDIVDGFLADWNRGNKLGYLPIIPSYDLIDILYNSANHYKEEIPKDFINKSMNSLNSMIDKIDENIDFIQTKRLELPEQITNLINVKKFILELRTYHKKLK
jgi:hypothetical protein